MSKVRINDLAKELEVKSRAILDVLPELGISGGKTHSSSLEADEADKVRARLAQQGHQTHHASGSAAGRHGEPAIVPKIDLSHISKPGDVLKAVLAKRHEEEEEARHVRVPVKPAQQQPATPAVHTASAAAPPATLLARSRPPLRRRGQSHGGLFRNLVPLRPLLRLHLLRRPLQAVLRWELLLPSRLRARSPPAALLLLWRRLLPELSLSQPRRPRHEKSSLVPLKSPPRSKRQLPQHRLSLSPKQLLLPSLSLPRLRPRLTLPRWRRHPRFPRLPPHRHQRLKNQPEFRRQPSRLRAAW